MYFHKYSKYKPSNSSICESYIKPVGIFGNYISKCLDIRRKRRPISLHRVPPGRSNKVKTYSISVGSPCRSLTELQLIIFWHKEMVQWMNCKIRFALVGYIKAGSKLPTSWGCLLSQLWLDLDAWVNCILETTDTVLGLDEIAE